MIHFKCPHCGKSINVKDEGAGRTGKCPGCQGIVHVPQPETKNRELLVPHPPELSSPPTVIAARPTPPPLTRPVCEPAGAQEPLFSSVPATAIQVDVGQSSRAAHSLGIASLILGALSFFVCWLPLIGLFFSGLGLVLGGIGLFLAIVRKRSGIGFSIAGTAISSVALVTGFVFMYAVAGTVASVDEALKDVQSDISRPPPQAHPVMDEAALQAELADVLLAEIEGRDDPQAKAKLEARLKALPEEQWMAHPLLRGALEQAREAAQAVTCHNDLLTIGLALHDYHDTFRQFPPAYIADSKGTPMHSWRVILLPYMGELEAYEKYNWNEPWNSPNNVAALKGVSCYSCPVKRGTGGETDYVVIMDSHGVFDRARQSKMADVTDSPAETIAVVEVHGTGIHWAEPRDFELGTVSLPLRGHSPDGFNVLTVSGQPYGVGKDVSPDVFKALITRDGGEAIPSDALHRTH